SKNRLFIRQVERRVGSWVKLMPPLKVMDNSLCEPDAWDHNQSGPLLSSCMPRQILFVLNKCMYGLGKLFPDPLSIINISLFDDAL
nr:hypothetical protein [Tanacetum cinerariifolium]